MRALHIFVFLFIAAGASAECRWSGVQAPVRYASSADKAVLVRDLDGDGAPEIIASGNQLDELGAFSLLVNVATVPSPPNDWSRAVSVSSCRASAISTTTAFRTFSSPTIGQTASSSTSATGTCSLTAALRMEPPRTEPVADRRL